MASEQIHVMIVVPLVGPQVPLMGPHDHCMGLLWCHCAAIDLHLIVTSSLPYILAGVPSGSGFVCANDIHEWQQPPLYQLVVPLKYGQLWYQVTEGLKFWRTRIHTYIHTYIHTNIHTYIHIWTRKRLYECNNKSWFHMLKPSPRLFRDATRWAIP